MAQHIGDFELRIPEEHVPNDWSFCMSDSNYIVYGCDHLPFKLSLFRGTHRGETWPAVALDEGNTEWFTCQTDGWRVQIIIAVAIMEILSYEHDRKF